MLEALHAAEERIVAFLLSLSRRYQKLGYAASHFALRMTRQRHDLIVLQMRDRRDSELPKAGLMGASSRLSSRARVIFRVRANK